MVSRSLLSHSRTVGPGAGRVIGVGVEISGGPHLHPWGGAGSVRNTRSAGGETSALAPMTTRRAKPTLPAVLPINNQEEIFRWQPWTTRSAPVLERALFTAE